MSKQTLTFPEQEQFPPQDSEPHISVGIMSNAQIRFCLSGQFRCANNGNVYSGEKIAHWCDGRIAYDDALFDEILLEPIDEQNALFELADVTIGIDFHWQRNENQCFRGALKLIVEDDRLTAVNIIKVEDYLFCVIASEMSATASLELLKAHAVISRSWLMKPILDKEPQSTVTEQHTDTEILKFYERDTHTRFDVCADDHCQRYQGLTRAKTDLVRLAIEATRGEVLVADGHICDARFSKSCGGVSERFESCWDDTPHSYLQPIRDAADASLPDLSVESNAERWIRSTPDAFCNTTDRQILSQVLNNYDQETSDFYRWHITYSAEELSGLVRQRSGIDFGTITDLIPVERGASGRLVRLKIVGTKRTLIVGKELEIRKWLSSSHLYSSAFVIDKDAQGNFTLTGAGWGHGVGLCQIGAAMMGARGYHYDAILKHYFRGANLQKLW
ncbi:MAG: SpoIID/LytB domain-containing protein [Paludibacteraceae bacterium]